MMMGLFLCFSAIIQVTNAIAGTLEMAPVFMNVGEQRILVLGDFERYSMSGAGVASYTRIPPGDKLLLKGLKTGLATLYVNRKGNQNESRIIRIEPKKNLNFTHGLLQSLNGLNEIEVIQEGEHFILRGEVRTFSEAKKIAYLRDQYPKQIINETTVAEKWLLESESKIITLLKEYPSLKLTKTEDDLLISGSLAHQKNVSALEKKIKNIHPLAQVEIKALSDNDPTICFKVYLLEVKKENLTQVGMSWPEQLSGKLNIYPLDWAGETNLGLTLNALSQTGKVNILSSPELVVRAPGQAEIFAGGELPIRQHSKFTDSVIWKNVGLSLKLDVQALAGTQVRLTVETGLSALDDSYANDDIPGILSNHIKTQVDATVGKPLLLSGLLQEEMRDQVKGLPMLKNIPILGKLFGSESYRNHKSEFVAILLPYTTLPEQPMNRITSGTPKGYLPLPRESSHPEALRAQKEDPQFPWNVL